LSRYRLESTGAIRQDWRRKKKRKKNNRICRHHLDHDDS
jgi:hypothetical protein